MFFFLYEFKNKCWKGIYEAIALSIFSFLVSRSKRFAQFQSQSNELSNIGMSTLSLSLFVSWFPLSMSMSSNIYREPKANVTYCIIQFRGIDSHLFIFSFLSSRKNSLFCLTTFVIIHEKMYKIHSKTSIENIFNRNN